MNNGGEPGLGQPVGKSYDGPARNNPLHNFLNFILRILTAIATLCAIIVMVKSTQTISSSSGPVTVRWKAFPGFKWFMVANSVVFTYAVLAAVVAGLSLCTKRSPLNYSKTAWLTFIVDFLLAAALLTAVIAALTIGWIGRKGQAIAGWTAVCNLVDSFCDHVVGSVVASLIGFIFFALNVIIDVSAIHHLPPPRY